MKNSNYYYLIFDLAIVAVLATVGSTARRFIMKGNNGASSVQGCETFADDMINGTTRDGRQWLYCDSIQDFAAGHSNDDRGSQHDSSGDSQSSAEQGNGHDQQQQQQLRPSSPPAVPVAVPTSTSPPPLPDNQFKIGGLVELYADDSYFATPAIITDVSSSSSQYGVQNVLTSARFPRVDPRFVHEYRIYEDGTRASCNVGGLRSKIYMRPCAVESHSTRRDGLVSYRVSFLNDDGQLVRHNLPFSRVQRIHARMNGS